METSSLIKGEVNPKFYCSRCGVEVLGLHTISHFTLKAKVEECICESCFSIRKAKQELYWQHSFCGFVPEMF